MTEEQDGNAGMEIQTPPLPPLEPQARSHSPAPASAAAAEAEAEAEAEASEEAAAGAAAAVPTSPAASVGPPTGDLVVPPTEEAPPLTPAPMLPPSTQVAVAAAPAEPQAEEAAEVDDAPVARRLRQRPTLPPQPAAAPASAAASSSTATSVPSTGSSRDAAAPLPFAAYLASLPPLQAKSFARPAPAKQPAPSRVRVPAAYKRQLKSMSQAQLQAECESQYVASEKLKRELVEAAAPPSNIRWSSSVDVQSISARSADSVIVSESSFDADALPLDADEDDDEEREAAIAAAETASSTASFTEPREGVCRCTCECVSSASCYCRCDAKSEGAAAAEGSSASSRSCTCKCYCSRPKNWPRGVRYTRSVSWSTTFLAGPLSSRVSTSLGDVVRDRLLQAHGPPPAPDPRLSDLFAIRKSGLTTSHPPGHAGMGLVARVALKKGQRRVLDYAGEVVLEDKRGSIKDYDEQRWKDVLRIEPAATANEDAAPRAPRNTRYTLPLFSASPSVPFDVSIDALRSGNESRFLNDPREKRKCNLEFRPYVHEETGELRLGLDCIKDVRVGDELLVHYGSAYWRRIKQLDEAMATYKKAARAHHKASEKRAAAAAAAEEERLEQERRDKRKRKHEAAGSDGEGQASDVERGESTDEEEEEDRRALHALFKAPDAPAPAPPPITPAAAAVLAAAAADRSDPPQPSTPPSAAACPPSMLLPSFAAPAWTLRDSDGHYACTRCERAYADQSQFTFHWFKLHEPRFACAKVGCHYVAGSAERLAEHAAKHSRTSPKKKARTMETSALQTVTPAVVLAAALPLADSSLIPSIEARDSATSMQIPLLSIAAAPKPSLAAVSAAAAAAGTSSKKRPKSRPTTVKYTKEAWAALQAKKELIAQKCSISEPMLFGTELVQREEDVKAQANLLLPYVSSTRAALVHYETRAAPRLTKHLLKGVLLPDLAASLVLPGMAPTPLDFHACHDLAPGVHAQKHSSLLRIPVLPPSFQFPSAVFHLPKSIRQSKISSLANASVGDGSAPAPAKKKQRPIDLVVWAEQHSGWGVTSVELARYSRTAQEDETMDGHEEGTQQQHPPQQQEEAQEAMTTPAHAAANEDEEKEEQESEHESEGQEKDGGEEGNDQKDGEDEQEDEDEDEDESSTPLSGPAPSLPAVDSAASSASDDLTYPFVLQMFHLHAPADVRQVGSYSDGLVRILRVLRLTNPPPVVDGVAPAAFSSPCTVLGVFVVAADLISVACGVRQVALHLYQSPAERVHLTLPQEHRVACAVHSRSLLTPAGVTRMARCRHEKGRTWMLHTLCGRMRALLDVRVWPSNEHGVGEVVWQARSSRSMTKVASVYARRSQGNQPPQEESAASVSHAPRPQPHGDAAAIPAHALPAPSADGHASESSSGSETDSEDEEAQVERQQAHSTPAGAVQSHLLPRQQSLPLPNPPAPLSLPLIHAPRQRISRRRFNHRETELLHAALARGVRGLRCFDDEFLALATHFSHVKPCTVTQVREWFKRHQAPMGGLGEDSGLTSSTTAAPMEGGGAAAALAPLPVDANAAAAERSETPPPPLVRFSTSASRATSVAPPEPEEGAGADQEQAPRSLPPPPALGPPPPPAVASSSEGQPPAAAAADSVPSNRQEDTPVGMEID